MRLEAEMSTWEIPLYLADKKLVNSVVDEADIAFFVEWVPASLEMGIETEFHMNDKFMPSGVILEGAFMAQLTSESIAMALGGKMKGTWRMDQYPAATYDGQTVDFRIPFALENVAGKIGISADDTYSFGGRGTAYIGEKSKAKSITLGGKLGLQYEFADSQIYAHWTRGYRSGGYNFRVTNPAVFLNVVVPATGPAEGYIAGSWLDITAERESASDLARLSADLEGHVSDRTEMLLSEIAEHRRTRRALTRVIASARCLLMGRGGRRARGL